LINVFTIIIGAHRLPFGEQPVAFFFPRFFFKSAMKFAAQFIYTGICCCQVILPIRRGCRTVWRRLKRVDSSSIDSFDAGGIWFLEFNLRQRGGISYPSDCQEQAMDQKDITIISDLAFLKTL